MNRFAGALPTRLTRKTFWICVAVIVAMLACVSIVLSQDGGDGSYNYGPKGMPRPDGILKQQNPGQPVITYNATARRDGSILITRNGVAWITLANTKAAFLLSDPNGTGHTVVKFEHDTGSPVHGEVIKGHAPGR